MSFETPLLLLLIVLFHEINSTSLLNHLGTKTPYRVVANKNTDIIKYDGCEPIKAWIVIRHGTRLPSKELIKNINERLPALRDQIIQNSIHSELQLSKDELDEIQNWNVSVQENDEKILAHEGEEEMINLAERMQMRFPQVLPTLYSNTSYKFRYTATQRTQQSAHFFAVGLFGRNTANSVWYPEPVYRDPILRFYKLCGKWRKDIKKNPAAVFERNQFIASSAVQQTLETISKKLGFKDTLKFDDVHAMYMTCAFETSWTKHKLSPWCSVFNAETIKVLEYSEDLKYYWIDGYGFNITYKQACPAIKNMVEFFNRSDEYPKAVLYFTHSGTILKLLAHLGLYKDETELKHDNFIDQLSRLWKVSKIDAFASNLAVILHRCGTEKKILLLHQERITKIPGCSQDELCDFNTFINLYNDSVNNCNFNEMCSL